MKYALHEWIGEFARNKNSSVFLAGLWWAWRWHNQEILNQECWSIHFVANQVFKEIVDFANYLGNGTGNTVRGKWRPPLDGFVKLNFDSSHFYDLSLSGYGGLLRSDKGEWINGYSANVECEQVTILELLAINRYRRLYCETDSLEAFCLLSSRTQPRSPTLCLLLQSIHELLQRDWDVRCYFVLRTANEAAYYLAKLGAKSSLGGSSSRNPAYSPGGHDELIFLCVCFLCFILYRKNPTLIRIHFYGNSTQRRVNICIDLIMS